MAAQSQFRKERLIALFGSANERLKIKDLDPEVQIRMKTEPAIYR